jgi:replicative DNA helicase
MRGGIMARGRILSVVESERGALGASMLAKDACDVMLLHLREDDFYYVAHKKIYRAIKELYDKQQPVDMVSVCAMLDKQGELAGVGGREYIVSVAVDMQPQPSCIMQYIQDILRMSRRRKLVMILEKWLNKVSEDLVDDNIVERVESDILELLQQNRDGKPYDIKSLLTDYIGELLDMGANKKQLGYRWGWASVDKHIDPICSGDLIVIAGYTSMGKSAFALNVACNLAKQGVRVGILSMEDSVNRILNRLLANYLRVENRKIREAKLTKEQWDKMLVDVVPKLSRLPIYIKRCYDMDASKIKAQIRQLVNRDGVNVVIIDYLGMIKVDKRSKDTKAQQIGEITKSLKNIAIELNIAILLLAQLHEGANREARYVRPRVSDLRDSGEIGQDADVVLFISRPEVLQFPIVENVKGEKVSTRNYAEIIIGKQRDGSIGVIEMMFLPEYLAFIEPYEEKLERENSNEKVSENL